MGKAIIKLLIFMLAICAIVPGFFSSAMADVVPNPTVTGPIPESVEPGDPSHDYTYFSPIEDLSDFGFIEEEFFLEGSAQRYETPSGETGSILPGGPYPYKTRMVVRRPIAHKDFNGVVLLEWQNVTAGYELDAHWGPSWKHFVRSGYAWVGVSAQRVGLQGYPPSPNNGLVDWSPIRYGTLDVTAGGDIMDDSLCYDIFSQAAMSIRSPAGINPMAGLPVEMILAVGASQSAGRLSIYHNSIHPLHEIVDGYYLLVGGSGLRTDLDVKVFQYLSETDLRNGPGRRMADSDNFRSWEVTGTGHSSYISAVYRDPLVLRDFGSPVWPPDCDLPPYSRVRGYYVINAQYDLLVEWIKYDTAPPIAPKIQFFTNDPPVIARDELGISLGGIRLPEIQVPVALNTGTNSGATFCVLYGTYLPFEDDLLKSLYRNHGSYVSAYNRSIKENLRKRYILKDAAVEMQSEAARSNVPPR